MSFFFAGVIVSKHIPTIMRTPDGVESPNPASILRKLLTRLKADLGTGYDGSFFVHSRQGKFHQLPIGRNFLAKIPSRHASLLGKSNPLDYTGHAYRRSAARAMADAGATAREIQRAGQWSSADVAEEYIDTSRLSVLNVSVERFDTWQVTC